MRGRITPRDNQCSLDPFEVEFELNPIIWPRVSNFAFSPAAGPSFAPAQSKKSSCSSPSDSSIISSPSPPSDSPPASFSATYSIYPPVSATASTIGSASGPASSASLVVRGPSKVLETRSLGSSPTNGFYSIHFSASSPQPNSTYIALSTWPCTHCDMVFDKQYLLR